MAIAVIIVGAFVLCASVFVLAVLTALLEPLSPLWEWCLAVAIVITVVKWMGLT